MNPSLVERATLSSRLEALIARHPALTRIAAYGASRGLTEGLLGLRGLILATLLGPAAFGGWVLFKLAVRYAGLAALGVYRGLEYETVRSLSSDDPTGQLEADRVAGAAFAYLCLVFGAVAVAGLVVSLLVSDPTLVVACRAFALGTFAEQVWTYLSVTLRARGMLRRFAVNEVVNAGLNLSLTVLLAIGWGLRGAYFGFVAASVLSAGFILREVPVLPRWSTERFRRLLRVGFPLALVLMAALALGTVDRLIVAGVGGAPLLGLYAFGVAVTALATTAAWIVRVIVFPTLYRGAAVGASHRALRRHLRKIVFPFAVLIPPVLGIAAFPMGPAITLLVPQYAMALMPARIFLFTGFSTGLVSLSLIGVVAAKQQRVLPLLALGAALLDVGLSFLVLHLGWGLPGVAGAAFVSQTIYAAGVLVIVLRAAELPSLAAWLVRVFGPLAWCTAILLVLQLLMPMRTAGSAGLGLAVYLVALLPLGPILARMVRGRRGQAASLFA